MWHLQRVLARASAGAGVSASGSKMGLAGASGDMAVHGSFGGAGNAGGDESLLQLCLRGRACLSERGDGTQEKLGSEEGGIGDG